MMHSRVRRAGIQVSALALTLAAGCEPRYPIEYETEHLRVAKTFDAPICAGTLRAMEFDAARIAEQLGGREYAPVVVVLGIDAVTEHCPPNSTGCAHRGGPVYTELHTFGHEMVHAFVGEHTSLPFVEEGLAEALGGGMTSVIALEVDVANVSITEAIVGPTTGDKAAYIIAGHFVAWLIDRWGLDAVLSFRAALYPGAALSLISSRFEEAFGVSLESAELAWQLTAPSSYQIGSQELCGGPSEPWSDAQRWTGRLELDCDAQTTLGPLGHSNRVEAGMRSTALVDVLRPGYYQLSVSATRSGTIEIDSYACGCSLGIEMRERYSIQAGSQLFDDVYLTACRYRVSYLANGVEHADAELELELVEPSGLW
jgi:hypothetical protein